MLIAAWVALLLAGILPSLSLPEILQCQGNWRRFRGRLYRVSSVPAASNREVAVVLGDVALLVEDFREELGEEEDCPLGQVALHLAQALPAGSPSLGDMGGTGTKGLQELLGRDFHVLQAFGWNTVVRSGWPVFQLLYLLYRCLQSHSRDDPCINSDGYAWRLQQRLLQRPSTEELGLMAASWAFLASEEARECQLVASAALLAMAWIRLPVYDVESDALVGVAQKQMHGQSSEFVFDWFRSVAMPA